MAHPNETLVATHTRHLPYGCTTVYGACLNATPGDRDGPRKLLEISPIWGNRGTVGAQTILRIPNGSFDVELLETIIAIDPPLHFAADQKPLRYLEYDPSERLPRWILTPARQIGRFVMILVRIYLLDGLNWRWHHVTADAIFQSRCQAPNRGASCDGVGPNKRRNFARPSWMTSKGSWPTRHPRSS